MRTNLKIDDNLGYTGNSDARARRNWTLAVMIATVASITTKARLGTTHLSTAQEKDGRLRDFLWSNSALFSKIDRGDRTSFHILEVGSLFVLRINVTKDQTPVYCIELMFDLKNELGDRHFTGWVEK